LNTPRILRAFQFIVCVSRKHHNTIVYRRGRLARFSREERFFVHSLHYIIIILIFFREVQLRNVKVSESRIKNLILRHINMYNNYTFDDINGLERLVESKSSYRNTYVLCDVLLKPVFHVYTKRKPNIYTLITRNFFFFLIYIRITTCVYSTSTLYVYMHISKTKTNRIWRSFVSFFFSNNNYTFYTHV